MMFSRSVRFSIEYCNDIFLTVDICVFACKINLESDRYATRPMLQAARSYNADLSEERNLSS